MLHKFRLGTLILIACLQASAAHASREFHIDAGDAALTLNEFSRQSGVQILFEYPIVHQFITPTVQGEMEPDAALELLLAGTGLTYEYTNERTVSVQRAPPPVDSDELSRWLRRFYSPAQSWPEGAGPHVRPLIVEIIGADNYVATR